MGKSNRSSKKKSKPAATAAAEALSPPPLILGMTQHANSKASTTVRDVSIVTPTQESRFPVLLLLASRLAAQTAVHRIREWVLCDGTMPAPSASWSAALDRLRDIITANHPQLAHVELVDASDHIRGRRCIANFRNAVNRRVSAQSTYVVACDDDDIYPNVRVEAAIKGLELAAVDDAQLVGTSPHFVYDPDYGIVFAYRHFAPFHCCNNSLAYRRDYIDNHRYGPSPEDVSGRSESDGGSGWDFAEEQWFLNKYSERMVQLPQRTSVLQLAHEKNTFNKRTQFLSSIMNSLGLDGRPQSCYRTPLKPSELAPAATVQAYVNALSPSLASRTPRRSDHEIVWYAGHNSIEWDPTDAKLGGSEQAIVHLSREFAKAGKTVCVYANLGDRWTDRVVDGVLYRRHVLFQVQTAYQTLILWRGFGLLPMIHFKLRYETLVLDVHDRAGVEGWQHLARVSQNSEFHAVVVKSDYHKKQMLDLICGPAPFQNEKQEAAAAFWSPRINVQCNGLRTDIFDTKTPEGARGGNHTFLYCSSYERGLENLLRYTWPVIVDMVPSATLQVMYGWDLVRPDRKKYLQGLIRDARGVTEHGRVSAEEVCAMKRNTCWHLYYTAVESEIDCISIRESCAVGCIPLISKRGVFAERAGIHLDGDPASPEDCAAAGRAILKHMRTSLSELDDMRALFKEDAACKTSWADAAATWLKDVVHIGKNAPRRMVKPTPPSF